MVVVSALLLFLPLLLISENPKRGCGELPSPQHHPTPVRMGDSREGQLPFLSGNHPELLPAHPSCSRHSPRGACPLPKPPPSVSYAGSGLEAQSFEEQDHTGSVAIRGTLLILCVCPSVWLLLGRRTLHTEQGGLKHTAQASAGHGRDKPLVL